MFYVYVLKSTIDKTLYIGQTNNLRKRIKQHNNKQTLGNRRKVPYELIYAEETNSRLEARILEKKFKSGFMREYFKRVSNKNLP